MACCSLNLAFISSLAVFLAASVAIAVVIRFTSCALIFDILGNSLLSFRLFAGDAFSLFGAGFSPPIRLLATDIAALFLLLSRDDWVRLSSSSVSHVIGFRPRSFLVDRFPSDPTLVRHCLSRIEDDVFDRK